MSIETILETTVAAALDRHFERLSENFAKKEAAPEVMTQAQLCKYLGVAASTVIEKQKNGGLPVSYALGEKSPRYVKAEVDKWLKGERL